MTTITVDATIINNNVNRILAYHESAVNSMTDSIKDVAQAGFLLRDERDARKGSFNKWVEENLPFTRKTAYKYIKMAGLVEAGLNLEDFDSVRQALLTLKTNEKGELEEKERPKDKRVESIPGLCMKIEKALDDAAEKSPVDSWGDDQVRAIIRALESLLTRKRSLENVLS
jgi:hypothetical protein